MELSERKLDAPLGRTDADSSFCEMRVDWATRGHDKVAVTHRALGVLALNDARGDALTLRRTACMIERESNPVLFLNLQVSGSSRLEQGGRSQTAAPGDLLLFDSQQPFVLEVDRRHHVLSTRVPYAALEPAAVTLLRQHCVAPLGQTSPWLARALVGLVQPFAQRSDEIDFVAGWAVAEALLGLLCTFPEARATRSSSQRADAERLRRCIAELHADQDLKPADLADALGVSLRRLYALCAAQGGSCMELVYAHRLERARTLLLRPGRPALSMSELAAACGFGSAPHFSRRFAQRFGFPPTALRKRR